MNTRTLLSSSALAVTTIGLLAMAGSGIAYAGSADTSGDGGVASGNQVQLPINLPINIGGNAVGILGSAQAHAVTKTVVRSGSRSGGTTETRGRGGILSGNQVIAPVNAPVTACGNAIGALGSAETRCASRTIVTSGGGRAITSGKGGILAGNQILAPINAPLSVCGNALDGKALVAFCRTDVDTDASQHGSTYHRPHASAQLTDRDESEGRSHGRLPFTGAPTALLAGIGLAALAAGGALLILTKRRRSTPKPAQ